jgi:endonuclease/exonuclease/phosphatase family metal-dependent hydrolase
MTKIVKLPPGAQGHMGRVALATRLSVPGIPGGIWVVNTHLDHRKESVRLYQLERVRQLVGTLSGPVILAGDFNSGVGTLPIRRIVETFRTASGQRLRDTWKLAGQGNPNTIPWNRPSTKLDWIFATPGLAPKGSRVATGVALSDHLPVTVQFVVTPAPSGSAPASPRPPAPAVSLLGVGGAR